jgi:predicted nucleic acid-binding protein
LDDVPDQSARTQALFANIARGSASYQTCGTVIFECVYVLQSHYAVPRVRIREALLPILQLEHLLLPHRTIYPDVFDIYVSHRSLSFADCYHAVLSRHLGCPAIISFDRGLDKIPDLVRTEPPLLPRPT